MNYYEILEIPSNADESMIRSAFRRLARRYHPDAGRGSSSERFREVSDAYETLIDPDRRIRYDKNLKPAVRIPVHVEDMRQDPSLWSIARPISRPPVELNPDFETIFSDLLGSRKRVTIALALLARMRIMFGES